MNKGVFKALKLKVHLLNVNETNVNYFFFLLFMEGGEGTE